MSSTRWDDFDGMTRWRSAEPAPRGELFVLPSPDTSVADMLVLSGAIPLAVHLYPPPPAQSPPYVTVEPLGATSATPARRVRVAHVHSGDSEVVELAWDPDDFPTRVAFGDVLRRLATELKR